MSHRNPFILCSKGQWSRSHRLCWSSDWTQYCRCCCIRKLRWVFPVVKPHCTNNASHTAFTPRSLPRVRLPLDAGFSRHRFFHFCECRILLDMTVLLPWEVCSDPWRNFLLHSIRPNPDDRCRNTGSFYNNKCKSCSKQVCRSSLSLGRTVHWPRRMLLLVRNGEYAAGRDRRTDGQTDGRTPDRYIVLSSRSGQRNNSGDFINFDLRFSLKIAPGDLLAVTISPLAFSYAFISLLPWSSKEFREFILKIGTLVFPCTIAPKKTVHKWQTFSRLAYESCFLTNYRIL